MTDSPETVIEPTGLPRQRSSRLNQTAAWVAIVAGIVFIVGAVFFTGFFLGRHSGGDCGGHRHGRVIMHHRMHPPMEPGMMPPPPPEFPMTPAPTTNPARP